MYPPKMNIIHSDEETTSFMGKRNRVKLDHYQTRALQEYYSRNKQPTVLEREEIASKIGIPQDKVKNWFQNQRAKEKSEKNDEYFYKRRTQSALGSVVPIVYPGCNDLFQKRDVDKK